MKIIIEGTSEELANVLRKLVNGDAAVATMSIGTEAVVSGGCDSRQNTARDTICYAR